MIITNAYLKEHDADGNPIFNDDGSQKLTEVLVINFLALVENSTPKFMAVVTDQSGEFSVYDVKYLRLKQME